MKEIFHIHKKVLQQTLSDKKKLGWDLVNMWQVDDTFHCVMEKETPLLYDYHGGFGPCPWGALSSERVIDHPGTYRLAARNQQPFYCTSLVLKIPSNLEGVIDRVMCGCQLLVGGGSGEIPFEMVRAHNGIIEVRANVNVGLDFSVTLTVDKMSSGPCTIKAYWLQEPKPTEFVSLTSIDSERLKQRKKGDPLSISEIPDFTLKELCAYCSDFEKCPVKNPKHKYCIHPDRNGEEKKEGE